MGILNHKARFETPDDLCDLIKSARAKPSPFELFQINQTNQYIFQQWTNHLSKYYKKKCPFPIRPIRELELTKEHPRLIKYRDSYNGHWVSGVVKNKIMKRAAPGAKLLKDNEFVFAPSSYEGILNISAEKVLDLQCLKRFCGPKAQEYFSSLPHT
ncbi:unnamed protein product [Psylliodes chrysocephalus]|uniref:Uncharacterized protein n=1 Tax=Psylliodes chrysocephalus TaxID=3402493 RepID=A0A9P0CG97_9CUCU|nr:unnamed protein product [Psylliodes chrysocephala]